MVSSLMKVRSKMSYEKQLLIELETKQDALQNRMDHLLHECATEYELAPLFIVWCNYQNLINQLKKEIIK